MRVSELLSLPHLRLELVAGQTGAGAEISWAQTSDLATPWEFLTEGELLMKNGQTLPRSPAAQQNFLRKINELRVGGLVIGLDSMTPRLSPRAIDFANDVGLPIILAPYSVSFAAIAKAVAFFDETSEAQRLALTEKVYNTIRSTVAGRSRDSVLDKLERDLACRVAVLDAHTGEIALDGTVLPPKPLRDRLIQEVQQRDGAIPGVIHLSSEGKRGLVAEVPVEEPTVLLIYDFRNKPPDTVLLQHIATAFAVLLAEQGMLHEYDRRIGGELLSQLIDGRVDPDTAEQKLKQLGLELHEMSVIAITDSSETGQRQIHNTLNRARVKHLLLHRSDVLYALLVPTEASIQLLRRRLGESAHIGISDPIMYSERFPDTSHEAVWAARVAWSHPDRVAWHRDATLFSILRDASEARIIVDRILGDLMKYDREHDTELLHTLETFLRCQRSWQTAAKKLHVHRQTVIYRVKRIEQITGRQLIESAHIAELWLALQARELISLPSS